MPNVGEIVVQTGVQMRPRDADDFYQTEESCLRAYLRKYGIPKWSREVITDPGVGTGVYGKVLREYYPESYIQGFELNAERFPDPGHYNNWVHMDFLSEGSFSSNSVVGNPPYKHAEAFFWKAYEHIMHNNTKCGVIDFLLRLGFLGSSRRHESMWSSGYRPTTVTVCSTRPSFTGDGKTYPTEFAFFRWIIVDGYPDQLGNLDFLIYERTHERNTTAQRDLGKR